MLPKSTISSFLRRTAHSDPKFYYRTKTIYKNNVTIVYLFFLPSCVVIATAPPRQSQSSKHDLEQLETIEYDKLTFTREDNMYIEMKWNEQFLLIGFKDEINMEKFCVKVNNLGVKVGKRVGKRVVGNDEGETVSYKLDNESIDHISTDTAYEVFSIGSQRNREVKESRQDSKSVKDSRSIRDSKSIKSGKDSKNYKESKRSKDSTKHDPSYIEQCTSRKDLRAKYDLRRTYGNECSADMENNSKRNNSDKRHTKSDRAGPSSKLKHYTSVQEIDSLIKSQIEFGDLNFFVLTEPIYSYFCRRVMLRLCEHFDSKNRKVKNNGYNINLNEHFILFVRRGGRLYRLDNENDFAAAVTCLNRELDVVVKNRE